jgi:hypothetical protein
MHGKWSQTGVPKKGWSFTGDIEDLGSPNAVCEMCETVEIRYVHYMEHPKYPDVLGCGCVCAEKMEEDHMNPRRREAALRASAGRRKRWLSRKWKVSAKGNPYINADGFNITIFPNGDGSWGGRIENRASGGSVRSRRFYKTPEQAKLAAFDKMVSLKPNCSGKPRR